MLFGAFSIMADDAPAWLKEASKSTVPVPDRVARYAVLSDETRIEVDESGGIKKSEIRAIRVIQPEGRNMARAQAYYESDISKVLELRAWFIRPNGEIKKLDKNNVIDEALVGNDVYNEARVKVLSASGEAEPGTVFGYEIVTEEKAFFNQFRWLPQETNAPVIKSRFSLSLPPGWSAKAKMFNHAEINPAINENSYSWEIQNLSFVTPEPMAPSTIKPILAISIFPPSDKHVSGRSFTKWSDVSLWYSELSEPQAILTPEMIKKAQELTAGKNSEMEKISAIARFCQDINYISIQMGIGRFKPHASTDVFGKSYGDCKDKANLMRALLKAIGITGYPVLIFSGDRRHVREEWPSALQFNHCIIAIKLNEPSKALAIVQHETLGSLLIFDPTDPHVKPGNIPKHEQGSFFLLAANDAGRLMQMPMAPPEANHTGRNTEMDLDANGTIRVRIHEDLTGSAAASATAQLIETPRDEFNKSIERWIASTVTGAQIEKINPQSDPVNDHFTLDVPFTAERYGQLMQGKLLVFNPNVVSRRSLPPFNQQAMRKQPVVLESHSLSETVKIKLPAGFSVDEMPAPVKISTPFAYYASECSAGAEGIVYTRSLLLQNAVIPAQQYGQIRDFFASVRNAEQTPVVLIRK
jgi:hypothetical protein